MPEPKLTHTKTNLTMPNVTTPKEYPAPKTTLSPPATPTYVPAMVKPETQMRNESNITKKMSHPEVSFKVPGFGVVTAMIVTAISAFRYRRLR